MDETLIERLRADLDTADYRFEAVRSLLGAEADDARQRGLFSPALHALGAREASPLGSLILVFLLGQTIDDAALDAVLPKLGSTGALELGLVRRDHDGLRAALSLNPVEIEGQHWWIISDLDDQLRREPARPDHVMGVGGATRSLIAQLPPAAQASHPRALDLGTGCGIVALHLALRGPVVGTDISERALRLARANAVLNGLADRIEFRLGDLFAPVAGERFGLIASNPPFVITPRGDDSVPQYEYRDGGAIGDGLAQRVVHEAPAHLAPGGSLICLANWESRWGEDGLRRVEQWVETAAQQHGPLAAWAIERDRVSPVRYAETWVRDGGARPGEAAFDRLVNAWLEDFEARKIVSIGLGAIRLRRLAEAPEHEPVATGAATAAASRYEQAGGAYHPALGTGIDAAFTDAIFTAGLSDAEVLQTHWLLDGEVAEHREHRPGEEAPRAIHLTTARPIARTVTADPLLAAALGACDGDLTLGQIADALATLLEVDAAAAADALVTSVRELVWFGMLAPTMPAQAPDRIDTYASHD